jgi:hypothetical protein
LKRIFIPVAAIAVLAIGGAWWVVLRVATNPAADAAQANVKGSTTSAGTAGGPQLVLPAPATTGRTGRTLAPASIALRKEIRDAPDLRAYYDRVKDLPDPTGERSYRLAEAIFECSIFVDKPPLELDKRLALTKSASENARRNQVLATMVARCKGFNGMGAGLAELTEQLHKRAEVASYPAAVARSLRFEPAVLDLQHADTVATGLLATNPDPEVLLQVHQYLNVRNSGEWLRQNGVDVQSWTYGWALLECDFGADCGPQSRPLMMVCVLRGECELTRMEQVVMVMGGQAAVNGADDLRIQLARRIASRDWVGLGFIERSNK